MKVLFDYAFKVAIIVCAVAFIYSNWDKGRYVPYFADHSGHSMLDTKAGVLYISKDGKIITRKMVDAK